MSLNSLDRLLQNLETQDSWSERRLFKRILQAWPQIVGAVVAAQTRPLTVKDRVLKVATSNSTWAQNLVFERQRIVSKLNQQLGIALTDIRFSTAGWKHQVSKAQPPLPEQTTVWQEHPSWVPQLAQSTSSTQPLPPSDRTPETAFQQWASLVQRQAQTLPTCPKCQCPCPPGELERWSICSICLRKSL